MVGPPGPEEHVEYPNLKDTVIPHEEEHAEAFDSQMRRTSSHAAIDNLVVITTEDLEIPSSGYVEAEAVAAYAAVNDLLASLKSTQGVINGILAVLRDAELIPSPPPGPPQ